MMVVKTKKRTPVYFLTKSSLGKVGVSCPALRETAAPRHEVSPLGVPGGKCRVLNPPVCLCCSCFPHNAPCWRCFSCKIRGGQATSRRKGDGCIKNHSAVFLLSARQWVGMLDPATWSWRRGWWGQVPAWRRGWGVNTGLPAALTKGKRNHRKRSLPVTPQREVSVWGRGNWRFCWLTCFY